MSIVPPVGPEGEEVDYEIEKEVWNIYELVDGTKLRVRSILMKLVKSKTPEHDGTHQFGGGFQNLVDVKANPRMKGPPSTREYAPDELNKLPRTEVNFSPIIEDWNVYRLPGGDRIKVKLVVATVFRVKDRFNLFGDPLYLVNSQNVITGIPKTE